ncbi:MAG: hypothetical protein QNL97_09830 [Pseudomonadales bacterium]|jgi:hypothetical protein
MTAKKLMSGEVVDGNAIAQTTSSRESCLDKSISSKRSIGRQWRV